MILFIIEKCFFLFKQYASNHLCLTSCLDFTKLFSAHKLPTKAPIINNIRLFLDAALQTQADSFSVAESDLRLNFVRQLAVCVQTHFLHQLTFNYIDFKQLACIKFSGEESDCWLTAGWPAAGNGRWAALCWDGPRPLSWGHPATFDSASKSLEKQKQTRLS